MGPGMRRTAICYVTLVPWGTCLECQSALMSILPTGRTGSGRHSTHEWQFTLPMPGTAGKLTRRRKVCTKKSTSLAADLITLMNQCQ
ncbi:hypothetical protein ARMGADRAFT_94924 [Armillaria gallica]|uniref:Secreted protein n=1 Tax=Armillaria gallica TaxID=47427 RepID=A0A2H3CDM8_ARMGA|nr:hypothetical protein ARMGADRAFT_94924 [Armillaria gallica]